MEKASGSGWTQNPLVGVHNRGTQRQIQREESTACCGGRLKQFVCKRRAQGIAIAGSYRKLEGRPDVDPPSKILEGTSLASALILDFWSPEPGEKNYAV